MMWFMFMVFWSMWSVVATIKIIIFITRRAEAFVMMEMFSFTLSTMFFLFFMRVPLATHYTTKGRASHG